MLFISRQEPVVDPLGAPMFANRMFCGVSCVFLRCLSDTLQWLLIAGLMTLAGCGGSASSGGGGNQAPPPTFTLSLSSPSLSISAGASGSVTINLAGSNGFNSNVSIGLSNLPSGVTVSPPISNLSSGQSQQFTVTVASYASASISSVSVTGTSGTQSQQVVLKLQITAYTGNVGLTRTGYTRTDAVQPYTVLFDSANNRFFMSDPGTNQIFVLDASSRRLIGTITVPGAYGMDETPDHSVLYAGTQIGDVYAIDPAKMVVTQRYLASQIGPNGYQTYAVQVMANGELALLGGQGGIPSVDGYSGFAFWNPADNSIQEYGVGGISHGNCSDGNYIFTFTVTGDRSLLVLQNSFNGNVVCTVDPVTGQVNSVSITGWPATPTPDGKSILVLVYGISAQIVVLDAKTLAQTATFPVGDFPSGTYMVISPDSGSVYLAPQLGGIVYAFNISTGVQVGWIPDVFTEPIGTWISATDNTGLLSGVNVEGIGFLDAAAMRTGTVGTAFLNGYLTPATGPVAGGTSVDMGFGQSENLAAVYFGQNLAASIGPNSNLLYATTPAGSSGPVDVVSIMTDGGMQILPEAFSYGPTILEATPNASTADGGGTGIIYGYGLGPSSSNQIPQGLQVAVGGQQVQITTFNVNGYSYGTAPTPLQSVSFIIPKGTAGTAADVSVSTPVGTSILPGGLQYLPAVQQAAALSGAPALAQGIYDSIRDVYYFTDASEIRVYSRTLDQWLSPIQVPSAPTGATHRLWGIALSPNGSNLAVADASAGMIYLLNPGSPGSVQSFPFNLPYAGGSPDPLASVVTDPSGIAVSDSGMIYVGAFTVGGTGYDAFFKLDSSSGHVTDYQLMDCAMAPLYKLAISSDNSHIFLNDGGMVFSVNTTTDTLTRASSDPGGCYGDYDLNLSNGQSTLEASSYLYDGKLNAESYLVLNDRDASYVSYVYGTQLSADGTLLFQPSISGIDVYDARLGTLRSRIALPFTLSQNYDALVADGKDNVLIAITSSNGSGIAIVDLSSLTEPTSLPYNARVFTTASWENSVSGIASAPHRHAADSERRMVPRLTVPHVTTGSVPSNSARHPTQTPQ